MVWRRHPEGMRLFLTPCTTTFESAHGPILLSDKAVFLRKKKRVEMTLPPVFFGFEEGESPVRVVIAHSDKSHSSMHYICITILFYV